MEMLHLQVLPAHGRKAYFNGPLHTAISWKSVDISQTFILICTPVSPLLRPARREQWKIPHLPSIDLWITITSSTTSISILFADLVSARRDKEKGRMHGRRIRPYKLHWILLSVAMLIVLCPSAPPFARLWSFLYSDRAFLRLCSCERRQPVKQAFFTRSNNWAAPQTSFSACWWGNHERRVCYKHNPLRRGDKHPLKRKPL